MNIEISLNQGKKYKNYQDRIIKGIVLNEKKFENKNNKIVKNIDNVKKNKKKSTIIESFINNSFFNNVFIDEAKNKVNTKQTNAQESLTLQNYILQYNDLISQYQNLSSTMNSNVYESIQRSTSDDLYRGTNIQLSNGATGYVTKEGIYKWYPTNDIINSTQGKNGCPSNFNSISGIDNPEVYNSPGQLLNSNPKLLVGQEMKLGQSCGNEGENVYVNSMVNNANAVFNKCYFNYKKNPPSPQIPSIISDAISYFPFVNDANDYGTNALQLRGDGSSGVVGIAFLNNRPCLTFSETAYAITSAFNIPDQLSMAYWAYIPPGSNDSETVSIGDGTFSGNTSVFQGDIYSNVLNTFIALPSFWTHVTGPYTVSEWIHMAYCIDVKNRIIKYYINGQLYAEDDNAGSGAWFQLSSYHYTFGRASDTAGRYLPGGGISQFLSYNKMLSDQEVQDIYNYTSDPSTIGNPVEDINSYDTTVSAMVPANVPYNMTFNDCKLYALDNEYQYFGLNNTQSDNTGTCMVSNNYAEISQFGEANNFLETSVWNSGLTGIKLIINGGQMCIVNYDSYNREIPVKCFPDTLSPECVNGGVINGVSATWGANCNSDSQYSVANGNATNAVNSAVQASTNPYQVSYKVGDGMSSDPTYKYNLLTYNGSSSSVCSGGGGWNTVPGYPNWIQESQADAEKTCSADPNCTAFDMVPNGQNNGTNQCAFFGNQDITPGPYNNALGCYKKEQVSGQGDPAVGCVKDFDITYQCGNTIKTGFIPGEAIGQTFLLDCSTEQQSCACFLALQSDGNLCLYKGTVSNPIYPAIYCSMTNDLERSPNQDWVATKGKYGRSYMVTGEYLNKNEWLGSDDGSCRLIMQEDGYLNLVTSNIKSECINNNGGPNSNGVYMLDQMGNKSLIGKVGFIDENSILKEYPSSMIGKSTNYDIMTNKNSYGNDLPGMPIPNYDINSCKILCNDNSECNGFVFDNNNNNCWLKDSNIYPYGNYIEDANGMDLYIRKPEVFNNSSCSKIMNPIDTIQYANYIKGENMTNETTCSLTVDNSYNSDLINIENQLTTLADQISNEINILESTNINLNNQMDTDRINIKNDLLEYKKIKLEIENTLALKKKINPQYKIKNNNMKKLKEGLLNMDDIEAMVTDSDLNVLKNNYQYILWTILALGAIIVTINILKR